MPITAPITWAKHGRTVSKPCQQYFTCTSHDLWSDSLHIWSDDTWKIVSSFVLYSRKFSGPINESANIMSELQSALAAAERVFRLLDETEEPADSTDAKVLTDIYGDVELSHVSFGYTKDHTIIHDLSLHAEPGKLYCNSRSYRSRKDNHHKSFDAFL